MNKLKSIIEASNTVEVKMKIWEILVIFFWTFNYYAVPWHSLDVSDNSNVIR